MIGTWIDRDSSERESEDEEIVNLCLMAKDNTKENDDSEEVT